MRAKRKMEETGKPVNLRHLTSQGIADMFTSLKDKDKTETVGKAKFITPFQLETNLREMSTENKYTVQQINRKCKSFKKEVFKDLQLVQNVRNHAKNYGEEFDNVCDTLH